MQCLVAPPRNGLLVPFPVVSLGCSFPGSLLYSLCKLMQSCSMVLSKNMKYEQIQEY